MCVIAYGRAEKILPNVHAMMEMNPHGAGVAWTNHNNVFYIKGISSVEEATKKVEELRGADIVFHARIATHGGRGLLLTHPFPVDNSVELSFTGKSESLLFHNGIWKHYRDFEDALPNKSGPWSDTRIMAFMLGNGYFSKEVLPFCGGSWLLFYPKESPFMAGTWNQKDGVYYSNLLWNLPQTPYKAYSGAVWNSYFDRPEDYNNWRKWMDSNDDYVKKYEKNYYKGTLELT